MENLKQANNDFLLQRSLDDLHTTSKKWLSQIDFWKDELHFFQKLLDINAGKAIDQDQKKQIDHFQNLIIYYSGELLDEYHQKVRRHEKKLETLLLSVKENEQAYREEHITIHDEIESFEKQFQEYKRELFSFIESLQV
ncbi:hypothetical protein QQ008_26940 [Fulvivirgaceae bacterium BMA10]|uniref:Biogenesis of lysosome-related organelles complex 1 subunit 5 n=1 Tax=Splendidivirga corallicola TaxID=3051826 RepID=A0ABT8KW91_9BACT|nr:hypothetical protein [Fulvivirgaceae bacterium BMA10]